MGTVDISSNVERADRLQALMQRMQTLAPQRLKELEINLKAQTALDQALNGGTAISGASASIDNQTRAALASQLETVKQNLSQILGYVPASVDVTEMQKVQTSLGNSFTSAMPVIARNINSMQGGINQLLGAIDSGIMTGVVNLTRQVDIGIQQAASALTQQLPNPAQVIDMSTVAGTASQITALLNNPQALLAATSASITNVIDQATDNVNNILSEISQMNIQNSLPFVDNNLNSSLVDSVKQSINTVLNTPLLSIPEGLNLDLPGPPINTPANEQRFDYTTYNEYGPVEEAKPAQGDDQGFATWEEAKKWAKENPLTGNIPNPPPT